MQHFFLIPESFQEGTVVIKDPEVLHQLKRVLRMRIGEPFVALDNDGNEYLCVLTSLSASFASALITEKRLTINEPQLHMTIYQALPKKIELFEWVLQKGTELGVSAFVPLVSARTERDAVSKRERLERIIKEAAEQSERGKIPALHAITTFEEALEPSVGRPHDEVTIVLHGRGATTPLAASLSELRQHKTCRIFIGPEGGFTEEEITHAQEHGALVHSLGTRVLRTETAGIVAASLLLLSN